MAINIRGMTPLLQVFDMRSYVEHMRPVVDVLQEGDEAGRIATVNRRTRQIDVLARSSLLRVVESDALLASFRTDAGIDAFWQMPDVERVALPAACQDGARHLYGLRRRRSRPRRLVRGPEDRLDRGERALRPNGQRDPGDER